jgi:hypothetical protein
MFRFGPFLFCQLTFLYAQVSGVSVIKNVYGKELSANRVYSKQYIRFIDN